MCFLLSKIHRELICLRNLRKTDWYLELSCKVTFCIKKIQKKHSTSPQAEDSHRHSKSISPLSLLILLAGFFLLSFLISPHAYGQNSWSSRWVVALHRRFTNTCLWDNLQRDLLEGTGFLEFLISSPTPLLRDGAVSLERLTVCFCYLLSL